MSRLVQEESVVEISEAAVAGKAPTQKKASKTEKYFERVAKYIPSEIVALYLAASGAIAKLANDGERHQWYVVAFVACLVATPAYLSRFGDPKKSKLMHLAISTIAFAVWACALGGPFPTWIEHYDAATAEMVAFAFSIIAGIFVPPSPKEPAPDALPAT